MNELGMATKSGCGFMKSLVRLLLTQPYIYMPMKHLLIIRLHLLPMEISTSYT